MKRYIQLSFISVSVGLLNFFNEFIFLRQFKVCLTIKWKRWRLPIACDPTNALSSLSTASPIRTVYLLQLINLHWHIVITFWFTLKLTLSVVHCVNLDKCIMADVHKYNIIQSSFTALKSVCACSCLPPTHQALATTDLLTVWIVSPFPDCHIIGVKECLGFSHWLLSL